MADTVIGCQTSAGLSTMQIQMQDHQYPNEIHQHEYTHGQQQQQYFVEMPSPQLLRSKSLNDISNDSQIPSFASHRFINLNNNNNNNNNGPTGFPCYPAPNDVTGYTSGGQVSSPMPLGGCSSGLLSNGQFCEDNLKYDHFQQHPRPYSVLGHNQASQAMGQHLLQHQHMQQHNPLSSGANQDGPNLVTLNPLWNQTFDNNMQNLNDPTNNGQFNNQCSMHEQTQQNVANSIYNNNICNPLAINLEGVTEQIGNFHL